MGRNPCFCGIWRRGHADALGCAGPLPIPHGEVARMACFDSPGSKDPKTSKTPIVRAIMAACGRPLVRCVWTLARQCIPRQGRVVCPSAHRSPTNCTPPIAGARPRADIFSTICADAASGRVTWIVALTVWRRAHTLGAKQPAPMCLVWMFLSGSSAAKANTFNAMCKTSSVDGLRNAATHRGYLANGQPASRTTAQRGVRTLGGVTPPRERKLTTHKECMQNECIQTLHKTCDLEATQHSRVRAWPWSSYNLGSHPACKKQEEWATCVEHVWREMLLYGGRTWS